MANTPKLLLPAYALDTLASIAATPASHGAIVATQELRAALDTDPNNFTKIWTGGDQPVVWHYSGYLTASDLAIGDLITISFRRAIYLRIESSAFNVLGSDYNYAEFNHSADGSSWTNYGNMSFHGDGTFISSPSVAVKFNTAVTGDTAQIVMYPTTQQEYEYYRLIIKTENANVGANYKVYDVMHGYLLTLPNAIHKAIDISQTSYGGENQETPMGKQLFRGVKGGKLQPRAFTIIFSEVSAENEAILHYIFNAVKCNYPVLYMHNPSDKTTWAMCKIVSERVTGDGGLLQVEFDMEEF